MGMCFFACLYAAIKPLSTDIYICAAQLFIVEGVITVGLATVFAFILPNSHKKIMGLKELETDWVQWNMESDLGQRDVTDESTAWNGFILAVRDPKTWLFTGILYAVGFLFHFISFRFVLSILCFWSPLNF